MFKKLIPSILCLSFCLFSGCVTNPITGEEELMLFPEQQDIAIGQKYAPEVEKQLGGRIEDQKLQNYINSVGQRVANVSHKPYFDYKYVAVKDKSMNAVALPGGYIFITKGMLKNLRSEAQLAAILAHETTHVVARDSSNMMSNQIGIGILLSAVISEGTSRGVSTATDLARQIIGLQYSRKDEREADLGGLEYMVRAGYAPKGMVETMQTLQQEEKTRPIEFLSSHPSPENRIEYINDAIEFYYSDLSDLRAGIEDYQRFVLEKLED